MLSLPENVHYIGEVFNPDRDPGRCQVSFPKWFTHLPLDTGEPFFSALRDTIIGHKYHLVRGLRSARSPGECKARIKEYLDNLAASRKPGLRSLLKDPIAIFSAEWLADRFDMDVVVMIRHPAGFVSSLIRNDYRFPFKDFLYQEKLMDSYLASFLVEIQNAPDQIIDQAILLWRIFYFVISEYRHRHPNWMFIRYEDLASNPEMHFNSLYHRLGLDWTESVEGRIKLFTSPENPIESKNPMDIKRNSDELAVQWKNRLNEKEIDKIKYETRDVWPQYYSDDEW